MNRCYRLVWNRVRLHFVVASELSRGHGKAGRSASRARRLAWWVAMPLSLSPWLALAAAPMAINAPVAPTIAQVEASTSPAGGQVTAGNGEIQQNGSITTINQQSRNLSLSWQSFDIGVDSTVNFVQPDAQAVAVNRIVGPNGSVILGRLNANGQVFLINPNGVLFGKDAQVNVGGLVASTLNISDSDLIGGTRRFSGESQAHVVNRGSLTAANGGYIALIGAQVVNEGRITAPDGTAALAGGNAVTLRFDNHRLLSLQVDKSTLNALADNQQLIIANGGQVLMSAGARDSLLASTVNNSGIIQAQTVENRAGKIVLLGGMAAGTTKVAGTLEASASAGNGGFIETSAAHVQVADGAKVTTLAAAGQSGQWLIDPTDFTIAAGSGAQTGSSIGANTLSAALGSGSVSIATAAGGTQNGDIHVNSAVSWSANKLTLSAHRDININADLNGSGTAQLALEYGQGAETNGNTADFHLNGAVVNLAAGKNLTTKVGHDGDAVEFDVITSLGAPGSTTTTDLQGMNGNARLNYALGANVDASATAGWNAGKGFDPLNHSDGIGFRGDFFGLGHTITGLTINRVDGLVSDTMWIGLFASLYSSSTIRDLGLIDVDIRGDNHVGGLVGHSRGGTIKQTYVTGEISGRGTNIGGLVGLNAGIISRSHAAVAVSGRDWRVGGLVGSNIGTVSDSYATGAVSSTDDMVGGLLGSNSGTVTQSYATGAVTATSTLVAPEDVGGLVGLNLAKGTIEQSYATGAVITNGGSVGGLVGQNVGTINQSYATGEVRGGTDVLGNEFSQVGGLVGAKGVLSSDPNTITNSYWATDTSKKMTSAGGTGVTSKQLMNASTFAGWDLATAGGSNAVWRIYNGHTAPLLRVFMTDLAVTAKNVTRTYDGKAFSGSSSLIFDGLTPSFWHPSTTVDKNLLLGSVGATTAINAGSYTLTGDLYSVQPGYDIRFTPGTLNITPAPLTVTVGDISRTYDGTTQARGQLALGAGTLFGTDTLSGGSFRFDNRNAGTGKTVLVSDVTVNDGHGGGNYVVTYANNTHSTITPAGLKVTTGNVSKVYDGTTSALGSLKLTGGVLFGSDSLSGGSFAFNNKHAGSGKTVRTSGAVVSDGNGGGNYTVQYVDNTTSTISPKAITGVSGLTAANKVYDGNTTASVSGTGASFTGMIAGDTLTVVGGNGRFSDKNAAVGKAVAIDNIVLGGADAGNYTLAGVTTATTADITPRTITVDATGNNKVYDGGTAGNVALGSAGVVAGDAIHFSGSGSFADKNVGNAKAVAVTGITAGGADVGNYVLKNTNATTTADIARRVVTVKAVGTDRVYDGTTADAVTVAGTGVLAGDVVHMTGTGNFADKHVGTKKAVTVDVAASGKDAGNYTFKVLPGTMADITPLAITVGAGGGSKVYDGTVFGKVSLLGSGVLAGDLVSFSGAGVFATKDVGRAKAVKVSDITATGADARNYSYNTTANTKADITPRAITVAATGSDRAYDGTTANAVTLASSGVIAGDAIRFSGTGQLADKNAGTARTVTVNDIAASGADVGNYSFNTKATTTVDITPRGADIVATGTDRVYDGTTAGAVTLIGKGILAGDMVSLSGTGRFDDKHVGVGKTVTVNDIKVSGVDAANYRFDRNVATTADITALGVTVYATGINRVYDGTTVAGVTLVGDGILDGDIVSFAGTGRFADKNVGVGKAVTVDGIVADGADAGNYTFEHTASATADVTPATLTYQATPTFVIVGQTPPAPGGTVTGLVGGETLADATDGNLAWTTPAISASPLGYYAIDGGGLSAINYVFVQAPGNAVALEVGSGSAPAEVTAIVAGLQQDEDTRRAIAPYAPDVRIIGGGVRLP